MLFAECKCAVLFPFSALLYPQKVHDVRNENANFYKQAIRKRIMKTSAEKEN